VKYGQILQYETNVGYAWSACLTHRLAQILKTTFGIDQMRKVFDGVRDVFGPVETLHGTRVDGGQYGQIRVEIVHFAEVFHYFEKF
jgi:hypothetical protein